MSNIAKLASDEDAAFNRASLLSSSSGEGIMEQNLVELISRSDVDHFMRVQNFRNQSHSLRINVSDVAACGGFHWYRSLPKLMFDHVYQGSLGRDLLQSDASLLGLELVSDEDIWMELAKKAGDTTKAALQQVLQVKKGQKMVDTVEEAMELREKVVKQASASKSLTISQLETLKEGVRQKGNALGGPVLEDLQYCSEAKRCKTAGNAKSDRTTHFRLRGAVDGIREEMIPIAKSLSEEEEDECTWIMQNVIVECKHRMNKLQASVPLYEMIQATAYCLMYNCGEADILQVLRHRSKLPGGSVSEGSEKEFLNADTTASSNLECKEMGSVVDLTHDDKQKTGRNIAVKGDLSHVPMTIEVTRLSIDDPLYCHRQNWYGTVLPRLVLWATAVYDIRSDDDKRYRLLASVAAEKMGNAWDLLHEECPWLIGCDTSYSRDVSE
eukprot:Nitzschia sp. Nitz4//scaffold60_size111251//11980//13419//NITZ4_004138-RA/size111251-snap-gene-0.177-mRNA-1//1//CDS//3329555537//3920//frame0